MESVLFGIWILVGISLFVVAGFNAMESYRFKANAVSLPGEIVGSSESNLSNRTSSPIVEYLTPAGERRNHTYNAHLTGASHWVGDNVKILYDSRSGKTQMDDWSELYLWPSLIA